MEGFCFFFALKSVCFFFRVDQFYRATIGVERGFKSENLYISSNIIIRNNDKFS